jgi:uncharacterized protein
LSKESPSKDRRRDRRYWLRVFRLALVAVVATIIAVPMSIGAWMMWGLTHAACVGDDPSVTPATYKLPYHDINIPSQSGGVYHGFFIPGDNGATIIVPPPLSSARNGMLGEVWLLARHGYSLVLYNSRMCSGKSATSLGYLEAGDVGDVLAYLKQNNDGVQVDLSRVAIHGFSSAGAASIMATARYPEIRAVLAEGGYDDMNEQMGIKNAGTLIERLLLLGAQLAYRVATGVDPAELSPLNAIAKIPPRPIFLVYGSKEVSLEGAKEQLAAARAADPNAEAKLWIVPGSAHGGYLGAAAADYEQYVVAFYDCALLSRCDSWNMVKDKL